MAPTAGILLTGGRSRRLGVDKASLVLDGETLAAACRRPPGRGVRARGGDRRRPRAGCPTSARDAAGAGPARRARRCGRVAARPRPRRLRARCWPSTCRRSTVRCSRGCGTDPAQPTAVPASTDGCSRCARATAPMPCSPPTASSSAAIRSLHELLDVVDHDVIDEAEWGAVAGPDAFLDIDTPADAERFGLDLPGLA